MKLISIVILSLALLGCKSSDYISNPTFNKNNTMGVIILGFDDSEIPVSGLINAKSSPSISLKGLNYSNGKVTTFFDVPFSATIKNGYVVMQLPKSKPNERYILSHYIPNSLASITYPFGCQGNKIKVINLKPGEVLYLGDYKFSGFSQSYSWSVSQQINLAAVQSYVSANYPELLELINIPILETAISEAGAYCY